MALKHGRTDPSLRAAYMESVVLGQELSKRIRGENSNLIDDDDENDNMDDDENESENDNNIVTSTASNMKKHFESLDTIETNDENNKFKKLLDMKFMKKATENKIELQKQEALDVLRQLKQIEEDMEEDGIIYNTIPHLIKLN